MAQFQCFDRIKDTSATTGTGALTLDSAAIDGYRPFSAVVFGSRDFYYLITSADEIEWEVGVGTYNTGTNALNRTTILSNSNGTTLAVTFSAGTKTVSMIYAAQTLGAIALPYTGSYATTAPTDFPSLGAAAMLAIGKNASATGTASLAIFGTASATDAMACGSGAEATAAQAVAWGNGCRAYGVGSLAFGNGLSNYAGGVTIVSGGTRIDNYGQYATLIGGLNCTVNSGGTGNHSYCARVGGNTGNARFAGSDSYGLGSGHQRHDVPLWKTTTDATPTKLELQGAVGTYGRLTFAASSAIGIRGTVIARSTGGDTAMWTLAGLIETDGTNNPSIIGTFTPASTAADAGAAWAVAVSVDTINDCVDIEVTGAAATTIKWVADLHITELSSS